MKAGWILCSMVVLFAAQSSLADEIGEISDDNFDQPPLSSAGEVEGKGTTKEGVKEEKKKESNATGSVEKGEKSGGRVDGKKPISLSGSGENRVMEMKKAAKTLGVSGSGEKREKERKREGEKEVTKAATTTGLSASSEKKVNETANTEKNTSMPNSAEKSLKESLKGEKIVMVSSTESEKKDKEDTVGQSKSIVAPPSEKNEKTTETMNKVKSNSVEKKDNGEKKEEKELKEVKKPSDYKATTQQYTTTVVTTVNLPLTEDSEEKPGMVDGEGEGASDEQDEPEGEQVKGEEKEEKKEEKKEDKVEEKRPYPIKQEYYSDSHFFSFFIFFLVISAVGYLAYHNKRKIMALLIEGRSGKGGRVRYHRLANDDNFERNVIY